MVRVPPELTPEAAVHLLAAAIDGRYVDSAPDADLAVDRAIVHRVSALVARTAFARTLPPAAAAALDEDARLGALHSAAIDRELGDLLAHLDGAGLSALVTKGAHLAHTIYPFPALRPRADTDLLVLPAQKPAVAAALAEFGYVPSARTSGSVILGQFQVERRLRTGITHYVDVHWRAAAPLLLEDAFDAQALIAASRPIAGLGPHARGPSPEDALALACIHLAAHHWHQALLVWLHDLRLLAERLSDDQRRRFVDAAAARRYTMPAYGSLKTARIYFESDGLDRVIAALEPLIDDTEPGAALIRDGRRPVDDLLSDLRHAGWAERAQLLREHVLPPAAYMRARFSGPLPLAYAKRFILGVRKWF